MKKYLLLLFSLALIACSKDDDSDNITFLEKYDGLGFLHTDDYYSDYLFFSNSNNFVTFVEDDGDEYDTYCFSLREGNNTEDGFDCTPVYYTKLTLHRVKIVSAYPLTACTVLNLSSGKQTTTLVACLSIQ